ITRHDVGDKTSQEDKDALSAALRGRHDRIKEWMNESLPLDGSERSWSDAQYAFYCMCVFEVEENHGPGLAGPPAWYREKQKELFREMTRQRFLQESNGPPCPGCGSRLRTPKAQQCFTCGWSRR